MQNKKDKFANKLLDWFDDNGKDFSWRSPEGSPYDVLIAEVMLRRTTATHVEKVYEEFISQYSSVEELSQASIEDMSDILRPLGLYNQRAEQFIELGNQLQKREDIPEEKSQLLELAGVGEYTADAVRCFAFGIRTPIIDSNVRRIFDNYFSMEDDEEIRQELQEMIPEERFRDFNFALIDLGSLVCRPVHHRCVEESFTEFCTSCQK